ncbi:MAG: thiamine phosphate synthase [Magnetococcales bacterium]|nr:thiamine phosphate synthase [Magnetococcales bacterium]
MARTAAVPEAIARHLACLPIGCVQLRAKGEDEGSALAFMASWSAALRTHAPHIRVVVNDRVDWVVRLGADGVHVGQEDAAVAVCRAQLTPGQCIGLSTHTLDEIRLAEQVGVEYVGFGPIFATGTKSDVRAEQGVAQLAAIVSQTRLPVVAIGGITLERLPVVAQTGVAAAAMISALWQPDWMGRLEQACRIWQESSIKRNH